MQNVAPPNINTKDLDSDDEEGEAVGTGVDECEIDDRERALWLLGGPNTGNGKAKGLGGQAGRKKGKGSKGRPPRGELQFGADFEGGNFGTATTCDGLEWDITIRHDTLNPHYRLWFHFQVWNAYTGQRAILNIVNFSKTRSLFRNGMTPVMRSSSQPAWRRVNPANVFYYRSQRHNSYILSMALAFANANEVFEFAYTYPYSYTALQRYLMRLQSLQLPYLRRQLLCRTPQQRRVELLTVAERLEPHPGRPMSADLFHYAQANPGELALSGSCAPPAGLQRLTSASRLAGAQAAPQPPGAPARRRRPVVFITARVHPGETPASHLVEGFLTFLLSTDPQAALLRREVTWVVVPMLNPDGTFLGNYRTDAGGVDLNRMWQHPSEALEPALHACLQVMLRYSMSPQHSLDVYLDVHAHSTSRAGFLFINPPLLQDVSFEVLERLNRLPRLLDSMMPGFSLQCCRWDAHAAKAGCGRRVAGTHLPDTLCYTLEISFFNTSAAPSRSSGKGGAAAAAATGDARNAPFPSAAETAAEAGGDAAAADSGKRSRSLSGVDARQARQGLARSGSMGPRSALPAPSMALPASQEDFCNTVLGYREMGRQLGLAFIDFYNLEL